MLLDQERAETRRVVLIFGSNVKNLGGKYAITTFANPTAAEEVPRLVPGSISKCTQ